MERIIAYMKKHAVPLLVIFAATFFVFGPSLGHDFLLNWDDPRYVTRNEAIRAINWLNIKEIFTSFYVGNYAPLHIVSYMVDYALWGGEPAGFIFGNILCHAGCGLLFYAILIRFSLSRAAALSAALVFLLHPVQVESVVWISQRKNVLSLFFYLLALLMYLRWFHRSGSGGGGFYAASLAAFAAALLVKSVAVILPLTLLVHDLCLADDRRPAKIITDKLPYLLAALLVGCLALLTQSADYGGGGRAGFHGGSLLATVYTMLPVFVTYIGMIVWPSGLSIVYAPPVKTAIDGEVFAAAAILLLLIAGAVWAYRRNRGFFFWLAAIPIGLLPVSQLVPLVTLMNDRYLYFPMIGVAACCGYLFQQGLAMDQPSRRWLVIAICAALPLLAGVQSLKRAQAWQNSLTLWEDAVARQPGSAVAWHTLGETYEKKGRFAAAIASEERARALCTGVECRLVLRKLAELYLRENLADKAAGSIAELLRLFPEAADGFALAGHLDYQAGDLDGAEQNYLRALQRDPLMYAALRALGNVYLAKGRPGLAMEKLKEAGSIRTPDAGHAYSMACAAALLGNRRLALDYLDEALRLGYNNVDFIVGNPELALLRGDPELGALLERYFPGR